MPQKALFLILSLLFLVPSMTAPANGDDGLFGQGVHAYFGGDYAKATDLLTKAIDGGSKDPRAFYFRGLSKLMSGEEGKADFEKGAKIEAEGTGRYYPISQSLERVQGQARLDLESARREAKIAVKQLAQRKRRARYEERKNNEPNVLRGGKIAAKLPSPWDDIKTDSPVAVDNSNSVPTKSTTTEKPTTAVGEDPFGAPPADTKKADPTDPFGAPPADTKKADPTDPFGAPPADTKKADPTDPFGAPPADTQKADPTDPFGAPPADTKKADPTDPFAPPADAKKADSADPFAPAKDEKKPADTEKADEVEEEEDPFALPKEDKTSGAKPAPKSDASDDDPFGQP